MTRHEAPGGTPRDLRRPTPLRRRLLVLFLQWFVIFLGLATLVIAATLSRARDHLAEDRLLLARTVAHYADSTLVEGRHELQRLVSELPSDLEGATDRLRAARLGGMFRQSIHLVDGDGRVLAADPDYAEPPPASWFDGPGSPPNLHVEVESDRPSLAAIQSVRRGGRDLYLVARTGLLGSRLSELLQELAVEPELGLVLVDEAAEVIAAPDQRLLLRIVEPAERITERIRAHRPFVTRHPTCVVCSSEPPSPGPYLTVMVPLEAAPWGVVLQQSERQAFAVIGPLQTGLLTVTVLLVLAGLFLSRSFGHSIIAPIRDLALQADRLREGDLDRPIEIRGDLEIRILGESLEAARQRIAESLKDLKALADDLEDQVEDRTRELENRVDDLLLLHETAALAARERDPAVFAPAILEMLHGRQGIAGVALLWNRDEEDPAIEALPPSSPTEWLLEGAEPPEGWTVWDLVHLGRFEGRLAVRSDSGPPRIPPALRLELAAALHAATLLGRILEHDAQRRVLVQRLLAAAEEERRRIARELHDEISQLLTVVQLSLEGVSEEAGGEVEKARRVLSTTQDEIHRIIYDLRPSLLDDLGLPAALRWYAHTYLEQAGLDLGLEIEEDLELPPETEITAFRIAQEIFTNVLRHSRAQHVTVELYRSDGRLHLVVEDDGVGFDLHQRSSGVGLVGLRERADLVGGTLEISTAPGEGTTVRFDVPLSVSPVPRGEEASP